MSLYNREPAAYYNMRGLPYDNKYTHINITVHTIRVSLKLVWKAKTDTEIFPVTEYRLDLFTLIIQSNSKLKV
jgi:hypothetical protein